MSVEFPGFPSYACRDPVFPYQTGKGVFRIFSMVMPQITLGIVQLQTVQKHCGMISVGAISSYFPELFFKTLYDYVCGYMRYSAVFGNDGSSDGNHVLNFFKKWSPENLVIHEIGKNYRMGACHTQSIFWKTLPWTDAKIRWQDAN